MDIDYDNESFKNSVKGLEKEKENVKKWYDGFVFGEQDSAASWVSAPPR